MCVCMNYEWSFISRKIVKKIEPNEINYLGMIHHTSVFITKVNIPPKMLLLHLHLLSLTYPLYLIVHVISLLLTFN
jgi:hypothetical protein